MSASATVEQVHDWLGWLPACTDYEDGTRQPSPLHEYAATVLSLVRAVS